MKASLIFYLILFSSILSAQTNVRGKLDLKDTQIVYAHYMRDNTKIPTLRDFFKPYLSYYNKVSESYEYPLMDSFLFCDLGLFTESGYYDEELWNFYLKNFFEKTKVPIKRNISSNNFAVIPESKTSSLTYNFTNDLIPSTVHVKFDAKALTNSTVGGTFGYDLLVGFEFFDQLGNEIKGGDYWTPYMDMYYRYSEVHVNINNFQEVSESFTIPPNTSSFKIHIGNWDSNKKLAIDNVKVTKNSNTFNLVNNNDSTFDFTGNNTSWELNLKLNQGDYYPFNNRNAILRELNNSNSDIGVNTKFLLSIPNLDHNNYSTPASRNLLKTNLSNYINNIENYYNNSPYTSRTDIAGLYYLKESAINPNEVSFLNDIFGFIRTTIQNKGLDWKLYMSPYQLLYHCNTDTSVADQLHNAFDVFWQQPTAFYNSSVFGRTDTDVLKLANEIMYDNNFNVNIESKIIEEEEPYGRINDYFDYGDKFGYINYGKVYYDNSGSHYKNSLSGDLDKRIDYDNLYKFMRKAKGGVIINNRFEITNENQNSLLHHWVGSYGIKRSNISLNNYRDLNFTTDSNTSTFYSENIAIKKNQAYKLKFMAKEIYNDGQANSSLIGMIFYDINGNEIISLNTSTTNLIYSTFLNSYYRYTNTTINFVDDQIHFISPSNAVSFKFYLKKWTTSNIQWKSIRLFEDNDLQNSRVIYKNNINDSLHIEKNLFIGKNSLQLNLNQFAITADTLTIEPLKNYTLKLISKEKLPILDTRNNKALIAIEAFDEAGVKLTNNVSIPGFQYTSSLQMHYTYISTSQDWNESIKTFQFPQQVSSVRFYIRNWNYNNILYIDNITFELDQNSNSNLERFLNEDNLFNRSKWSEKLPLEISETEAVYYNDFIDVSDKDELEFSALIRGSGSYPTDKDLLAVEFYDENFNLLQAEDINLTNTNMNFSTYYKFWWLDYIQTEYLTCAQIGEGVDPPWYRDQWETYQRNIIIPLNVKYLKFYFLKLSSNRKFKVLNPQLKTVAWKERSNYKGENLNSINYSLDEDNVLIYPNPTESYIEITLRDKISQDNFEYEIFDISGKIYKNGMSRNRKIDVSNLASGTYLLKIVDIDNFYSKLFIKK